MDQYGITAIGKSAPVLLLSLFLLIAGHLRGSSASVDGKRVARCLLVHSPSAAAGLGECLLSVLWDREWIPSCDKFTS